MASKIGVKEQEYDLLMTNLKSLHDNYIDQILAILNKLAEMNDKEGGFYAKEITPKINKIMDELRNIAETMHFAYEANESAIRNFALAVDNYDTMC